MKSATIFTVLGVVIIVGVIAMFAFRSPAEAPGPSPTPGFEDVSAPASGDGQFIQLAPDTTPDSAVSGESELPDDKEGASPAPTPEAESVTVSIDETGFSPSEITIGAGTTITFVNNGQAPHWPASDVHPTHEVLPEFDAERGLETGETYSYTFTEVGTWNMHDHLNPRFTGTVTVQ